MVSLETWVSLGTLIGVAAGLFLAIRTMGADLRKEMSAFRVELKGGIAELRSELKTDIADLRTELKADIADLRTELKGDIARLDDRVYALAAGLRPQLEAPSTKDAPAAR